MSTQPIDHQSPSNAPRPLNPWLFVPALYFMQSIPNILATESFVSVYKNLGVDNLKITFWTSIIGLPWTFKLFWGPLVDLNFTKRTWTIAMQVLITASLVVLAAVVPTAGFFQLSLIALFLIAIFSATHDIACDGFYLMSLDKTRQAAFSGVMGTCSRLGRMFASFGLLFVGGRLQHRGWGAQGAWAAALGVVALVYGAGMLWNFFSLPRPALDRPAEQSEPDQNRRNILRTIAVILAGICTYFLISSLVQWAGHGAFRHLEGDRFDEAMRLTGAARKAAVGALTATRPAKVPLNWYIEIDERTRQFWTLIACAVLIVPAWMAARRLIGKSPMGEAFATYFRQPGFVAILAFIMFYRFGEAMILKIVPLFFQDAIEKGGMGLDVEQVGKIYGIGLTVGLILGGLAGGAMISKIGLRRAFWPLVICMHVPNLLYVLVAYERPANHLWLYPVAFTEAFGYGFGFAGYFVYLMYVAQRGNFRTSHYAIGTGMGALFITFAGILSGILQNALGYVGFFIAACAMTIPGTLTLLFIPMDKDEARGVKAGEGH